ncbi:MAG: NAD(P)-dependent oxidoreductase [Candidatus Marinimicrobia bacterium]|jgi:UDP-glucose 4-epimerase|nr:NAD(P)-dependent oxidoreductase [Candidatus Neomarinimicrobiota bacterium]
MKVLVFGGSGFLGSYVVDALVKRGHEVAVYDLKKGVYSNKNVHYITGDILDEEHVSQSVKGVDVVYNFAGLADLNESIDEPKKTINLNIVGNLNIVEACVNSNVSKFVYASSAYVFSQKGGFYGVSKKSSEMIIEEFSRQHNLDYVVIRYGSVYGERADQSNRIYKLLYEALTTNQIIFPGDGKEEREYIHARDAAELSVDVLSEKYTGKRIMLTGVEKFTYMEVLEFIKEMMNDKIKVKYLNDDYKGHYTLTPYSFSPIAGVKLVNNPSVDFGQGVLECLDKIHYEISVKHESNN